MKPNLSKFQSSGTILAQRSKPKTSKVKSQSPGTKCVNFSKLQEGLKLLSCQSSRLKGEGFKKLKAVEVSGSNSTQNTPTDDPKKMSEEDVKNMLEIVPVSEFKVEALQRMVKEKFSTAVPIVDNEKALWVELKRHDMFMLTEKNYSLSNGVMTLMLGTKLQVEEDSDMARDLVMKIFIEANKPKRKSLDTSSK
nr:hypothetical protein [Tanacetum cinerariifolium]